MRTQKLLTPQEIQAGWLRKGLGQNEWARKNGFSPATVSQVLNGKTMALGDVFRPGDVLAGDEINYLIETKTFTVLRDIYDNTPASLVLAINPVNWCFDGKDRMQAFLSRSRENHIFGNTAEDAAAVMESLRLTDPSLRSAAAKVITKKGEMGGARGLYAVLEEAFDKAERTWHTLNAKIFIQAAKDIGRWGKGDL